MIWNMSSTIKETSGRCSVVKRVFVVSSWTLDQSFLQSQVQRSEDPELFQVCHTLSLVHKRHLSIISYIHPSIGLYNMGAWRVMDTENTTRNTKTFSYRLHKTYLNINAQFMIFMFLCNQLLKQLDICFSKLTKYTE